MTPLSRTAFLALAASAAVAAPAAAQPIPWANKLFLADIAKNPGQPPPPVLTFDFGAVPKGTLCARTLTITNIYDVPIQVINIRRGCVCLEAYPPLRVLQPNDTAEFTVTMDTAKFSGHNAQAMYVTFGPQYISTAVIRLEATSRTDVTINPGAVTFGTVSQGATPAQAVALEYSGRQRDWKVTEVVAPTGPFAVDVRDAGGRGKYYVNVSLKPGAPAGQLSDVVTLKTNDPAAPIVQVNVSAVVQAPLTLIGSDRIEFPATRVGGEAVAKVLVRSNGANTFRIEPVEDDGTGVTVETFPAAAPVQHVTIKFRPAKPGAVRREVVLKTDLAGGAALKLLVSGEGEPEKP